MQRVGETNTWPETCTGTTFGYRGLPPDSLKGGQVQHGNTQQQPLAAELDEFISVAAHDLRNPITVARASAQIAQRHIARGNASAAQARLNAIIDQTDRLTDTLERFLDAARVSAGSPPERRERVDLLDLVQAAIQRARSMAGCPAGRHLECEVPSGCVGEWDGLAIERAIRALLANALLYGDPSTPVRIEAIVLGAYVRVTVSGGGPGPDADESAHLFEAFYRGKSAANVGVPGSGLGLFVARGIVRSHGGDVRCRDGDRFEIELPVTTIRE